MITEHPAFPNPTIRESLCEIHFALPDGVAWDSSVFGRFFKRIQSEFPELEPVTSVGLQVQLSSGSVGFLPPQSRMRYKHASRNLLLQLSEGIMTVNVLPKYAGWVQMQADIERAWAWTKEVLSPTGITRVGLRYINFVPKTSSDELPATWFAPNDYIATAILASHPGFLSRVEVHSALYRRAIVTVAEAADAEQPIFVLDMDCIYEVEEDQFLDLPPVLLSLHDAAWRIFSGFLTPRLRAFLEGGVS
ncbi:MAG: TIGR04255 family protein [Anaerolineae bacterium]